MSTKPHKGKIVGWALLNWDLAGRFVVVGKSEGHPEFDGRAMHTSYLLNMKFEDGRAVQVETLNSIYDLGDPA